ncbi:hypothetical protein Pmani_013182 [Petrolisthes manimaculis]|uniref:Uncharacterized protein n=1 Tax=Petrolisthes manimaculis TaxID=1843537 RepID=A0AAE1PWF9_9EUCA|nr:hypothetical protein Pmani_013182 [Petrolisthes manimaculis]
MSFPFINSFLAINNNPSFLSIHNQCLRFSKSVGVPRGVLATAAPDKFPEAVAESEIPVRMDSLQHLETMPTKSMWMTKGEDWYGILRTKIEEITDRRKSKSKEINKG